MNFSPQDLLPTRPGFIPEKSATYRVPHTPFWNDLAVFRMEPKTLGFHGDEFFGQNKSTLEFEEDLPTNPGQPRFKADDPICGFAAYSLSTSVESDPNETPARNGTFERVYVFDLGLNEVRLESVATGNPATGGGHNRTATTKIVGNNYASPPEHYTVTLSATVNKTTLEAYLADWRSKPEDFREITGTGLGTGSYTGHGATKSESDGDLAIVGGGDVRVFPYTFTASSASGMSGDIAALWNGNFTAKVYNVTRKNAPVIHREQSETEGAIRNALIGTDIYRDGYSEKELSVPLTSWMDYYGVFEAGDELIDAPIVPVDGGDIGNLSTLPEDGQENDVFFISRDGSQYRVTMEYGSYSPFPIWIPISSEVLVTEAITLQSPAFSVEIPGGADYLIVAKIERKVGADWVVVEDNATGGAPAALITTSVRNAETLIFAVSRRRVGERWGFYPYSGGGETRYRVQTYKLHLTPGTVTLSGGSCGAGVTGNLDAEWSEEFDAVSGLAKARVVTQWEEVISGTDWTQEEPYDAGPFFGTVVVSTPTLRRQEDTATLTGRFLVAFDAIDPNGKIISTATPTAAVTFTGGINVGDEVALLPPAAGHSVFSEGYRLRY